MSAIECPTGVSGRSKGAQRPRSGSTLSAARARRQSAPKRCDRCRLKHLKCDRPKQGSCGICLVSKEDCSFSDRHLLRLPQASSDYQKYRAKIRQVHRQQSRTDSASDASTDSFDSHASLTDSDWSAASVSGANDRNRNPRRSDLAVEQQLADFLTLSSDLPQCAGSTHVDIQNAGFAMENPHTDFDDRHSASEDPFLRCPNSTEDLDAAREARFAKVWTGIDFRKWDWHLDPRTTSPPVLFSLKQAPPSAEEPYILLFDEKLCIEARPTSSTAPDLPALLAEDWTVRGPTGTLISPPWEQIRDLTVTTKMLWPELCLEEEDFDDLRVSAAALFAGPVIPFMCELAVTDWQDFNLLYLPELNSDLIKCRLPASSNRYQQSLILMLAAISAPLYGAVGMIFDKGRRVKVGTWEMALHLVKLAWLLMLPKRAERMSLKRLCFMQLWASFFRPRPDREMHVRVYRAAANDAATHAAIVQETQNLPVERELYKRWLTGHIASIMNHRLWESFECPYRLGPRLLEMGPLHMLPREGDQGMAHTLESSLNHNRTRREIDMIGERLFDTALMQAMPPGGTPEWTQAHNARRIVGRQFLDELIEYELRVLEPHSRTATDADPLLLHEYRKYQVFRCGRFITTAKLLASSLAQAGLLDMTEETEKLIAAVPKYKPLPAFSNNSNKPDRQRLLQMATGALSVASAIFGSGQGLCERCWGL